MVGTDAEAKNMTSSKIQGWLKSLWPMSYPRPLIIINLKFSRIFDYYYYYYNFLINMKLKKKNNNISK